MNKSGSLSTLVDAANHVLLKEFQVLAAPSLTFALPAFSTG